MKIRDRIKELRRVRAGDLLPNPKNWRSHPQAQQDALRGILAEVGYVDALLVRETPDGLQLIDGHLRAETTPESEVPVLVVDLNDDEADKVLATFDPLAAMAQADAGKLEELLAEVRTDSDALKEMLDSLADSAGIDTEPERKGNTDPDDIPEPPEEPIVQYGQLWLLGHHRLLCGDSTNADDVKVLMDGQQAHCVFTDPPYGIGIGKKNRLLEQFDKHGERTEDIKDDTLSPGQLASQLCPAFTALRESVMADDCTLFITAPQGGELGMVMTMLKDAGLPVRHVLIWKKNSPTFSLGRLDYDYAHEPILLTWTKRHKRPMKGHHRTSVWEIDKPRQSKEHPTMKPVELYVNAYRNNSEPDDSVADLYAGSGPAFIAAEQTGRRCFGMEISPRYCDVIVRRWEEFTGQKAVRHQP